MSAISSLFRSLYRLTRIGVFNDIANAIYSVDNTKRQVDRVKSDAERVRSQVSKKDKAS